MEKSTCVEASNISGWETKQIANGHEARGIKQIVDEISQRLAVSRDNENLIGIRARVRSLKLELQLRSGGVRMIGIWVVGGGGKTTLASVIYDEISSMFDSCCFVSNIREESNKNGLEKLQEKILSGILKTRQQELNRVEDGRGKIMARLRHKKVLIVLDDVDQLDQLKALVGSRDWFGEGSRIIITSRDEHLLNAHRVDVIHHIKLLNNDESVKLFRKHAHGDYIPMKDFEHLTQKVVSYASGLPLALTILGSFLCDKDKSQWSSALDRLKEIPDEDILGKLKISFDGLKPVEKELFLDIACFFRRQKEDKAMKLLDACGFHPIIGVEVLRQKALIVINEFGQFDMHDLVQEIGHYIVREKHPKNPENHSRVWKWEDVRRILAMNAEEKLDNIEAINPVGLSYEELQRFLQVAGNMNKLRWIDLNVFRWENEQRGIILPLPRNFPPKELCFLFIRHGILQQQLWEGYKYLPNLKHMELVSVPNLIKVPDFAGLPNLETFKLKECPCLEEIHPSIGLLERLVFLSFRDCPCLTMFPSITRIKKLETLILRYCYSLATNHRGLQFSHSALRKLDLKWCCLGDEEIGSVFLKLPNLEELNLSHNPLIPLLDFSILQLPRLKWLNVSYCERLVEFSELPSSIAVVIADDCESLESLGDTSNCKWLWKVSFMGENKLGQHRVIDTLIHSMLQGIASVDYFISVVLSQHHLPNRFVGRLFRRNTFGMHLPDDWYNDFSGFLICIVTCELRPHINITMKHEDPPFDLFQEAVEPIYHGTRSRTCVGYVSFNSFRHTTLLTSSYNIISLTIQDPNYIISESTYGGIELIHRKSKSDEVHITDDSEFWDKKLQDARFNTFTIQRCDSDSSVDISWKPFSR